MMLGPTSRERAIAFLGRRAPIVVKSGPGPLLPLSPSLWQARQPDWATTSLPGSSAAEVFRSTWLGGPAVAPRKVRYAIAMIVRIPAVAAIGLRSGRRSALRS